LDADKQTVQVAYRATTGDTPGPLETVGTPISVPASWITSTTRGLAVGTLATSAGGSPFPATWSVLEATLGAPETLPALKTIAPLRTARQEVSYTFVPETGRFYLAGGGSTLHEAYDPRTDTWSTIAPLPAALDHIQAVALG